jgi:hypothetical protein
MSMRLRKRLSETEGAPGGQQVSPARARRPGPHPGPSEHGPRRSLASRTRDAGAATVGAVGVGVVMLARLVMAAAVLIALLIGLAIVLRDVGANAGNTIVEGIHEGANFFAGSFTDLIRFTGHPKRAITVNWGIGLLAYLIAGAILARAIFVVGSGGLRFDRRHRTSAANY